ncbi:hypothetical protein K2173_021498 [Erythroxylum novogranatense]|uniref:HR-like lesion-inducer n=1 Tax=Erythroxylum novogranatense TaxID=1862640 RepID=A0AAV8TQS9_9ROSI|nr:hypothetical protein K2173_021498 [Erythroxylum novogranatense]
MGFFSFLGRLLFASLFLFSAWHMYNDFGKDGGPAAKVLITKLAVAKKHISSIFGLEIPDIDPRHFVAALIVQKGLGGLLFIFGSLFGAYLLLLHLLVTSPILYDFYNYSRDGHDYSTHLNEFLQNVALFGALLYFIGMKNLIPRRQMKKKANKAKAN